MTCDGAEWIRTVVAERARGATVCLDNFHLIGWATTALNEVRREEWSRLRVRDLLGAYPCSGVSDLLSSGLRLRVSMPVTQLCWNS